MHCFGGSEQLIKLLNEFFEKKYYLKLCMYIYIIHI